MSLPVLRSRITRSQNAPLSILKIGYFPQYKAPLLLAYYMSSNHASLGWDEMLRNSPARPSRFGGFKHQRSYVQGPWQLIFSLIPVRNWYPVVMWKMVSSLLTVDITGDARYHFQPVIMMQCSRLLCVLKKSLDKGLSPFQRNLDVSPCHRGYIRQYKMLLGRTCELYFPGANSGLLASLEVFSILFHGPRERTVCFPNAGSLYISPLILLDRLNLPTRQPTRCLTQSLSLSYHL